MISTIEEMSQAITKKIKIGIGLEDSPWLIPADHIYLVYQLLIKRVNGNYLDYFQGILFQNQLLAVWFNHSLKHLALFKSPQAQQQLYNLKQMQGSTYLSLDSTATQAFNDGLKRQEQLFKKMIEQRLAGIQVKVEKVRKMKEEFQHKLIYYRLFAFEIHVYSI